MSRRGRIFIPNAYYHVFARGQRKEDIFIDNEDKKQFIKILVKGIRITKHKLYAFCIMNNHYHLLLKSSNIELSKLMRIINTRYAMYFNRKYEYIGHVFQDRYKCYLILNIKYLSNTINYIHNNPVRKQMVDSAVNYLYSSANGSFSFVLTNDFPEAEFIDVKQITNENNEYIGSDIEFKSILKRKDGKKNLNYLKQRRGDVKHRKIYEDYKEIMKLDSTNMLDLSKKNHRIYLTFELFKRNYTHREIASLLALNRTTITNYLRQAKHFKPTVPKKER